MSFTVHFDQSIVPWKVSCLPKTRKRSATTGHLQPIDTMQQQAPPARKPSLRSKEIAWAEGLRGIAAVGVLSNHLSLCYANYLFRPCCAPIAGEMSPDNTNGTPHLFQRPIFRLVAAGEAFVALFLVLTGFTAAYKPLRYARSGEPERAYSSIAVSSFRRIPRLFLPATVATVFSWAVCNLGGYETSRQADAWWMIALTPTQSQGPWYQAFIDIWWAIWVPWMPYGVNPYDQPQWALQYFVEAGLMVFLAVLGTARLNSWWRCFVLSLWAYWSGHLSRAINDPYVGYCTLFGMVLMDLNLAISSRKLQSKLFCKIVGLFFVLLGLIVMSYPRDWPERAPWSLTLQDLGDVVLPVNLHKYKPYVSLGCLLLVFGINFSSAAQKALTVAPIVWLGKISFPLYLLHGTFIRSLFAWILFAGQSLAPSTHVENVSKFPLPSFGWTVFSVMCLLVPLLICSHLWVKHLEPRFDSITLWLENAMIGKRDIEPNDIPWRQRGLMARLKSTLKAIIQVIQHGGLPAVYPSNFSTSDSELECGALLHNPGNPEMCSPTRLFAMDVLLPMPHHGVEEERGAVDVSYDENIKEERLGGR